MTHRSMWKARLYLSAMMISLPEMLEQVGIRDRETAERNEILRLVRSLSAHDASAGHSRQGFRAIRLLSPRLLVVPRSASRCQFIRPRRVVSRLALFAPPSARAATSQS